MGLLTVPVNEEIMGQATWQAVLQHALQRHEVMDEINAVTSLHRAAKLYREDDAGRTPLDVVHRHAGFLCLLELTEHFAAKCRAQQIANALWAFAVLLFRQEGILCLLCRYAAARLAMFLPQNVSNSVWALGTVGYPHDELLDLVPEHVAANIRDYSPQDLSNTCWAFARLQKPCDALFRAILAESLVQLWRFQPQNMSNLVWACATVLYKDEAAMRTIASFAATRAAEFGTQELSNFTWGLATLAILCEDWMEESGGEMTKRSRDCVPQDLSNTLWAYGTLKHKRNEHMRAINWEVMRQIEWFSPQGLSNVIWGLSAIEYRDIKALTCISEEIIRRPMDHLTPPDISTLLYSFAVLAWSHEDALLKLRRAVQLKMSQFASRDVANVSWAMVTLSHRDDNIFRMLMEKAELMIPEFTITGLCNIAWAFVRFGLNVPPGVARGIAHETLTRGDEVFEEPGDAVLLSDAVCSEWGCHVPREIFDQCDAIGRQPYNEVLEFFQDFDNIPSINCSQSESERYQHRVTGFKTIQLGRRLTCEMLRKFDMLEEDLEMCRPLRRLREDWLLKGIQAAYEADPTDATMKHKTTCAWTLSSGPGEQTDARVVASGTAMDEPIRFVACVVEHPRSNDAEFQVLNKAADRLLRSPAGAGSEATLRFDVSEIPCLSCMGALRQFQKSFPRVRMRASFSIRKVMEVCKDCSHDIDRQLVIPPRQPTDLPKPTLEEVLENRGRGRPAVAPQAQAGNAPQRRHLRRPLGTTAARAKEPSAQPAPELERAKPYPVRVLQPDPDTVTPETPLSRPVSVYDQLKKRDWAQDFC